MTTPNKDPMVERIVEWFDHFIGARVEDGQKLYSNDRYKSPAQMKEYLRTTLLRFKEEVEGEERIRFMREIIAIMDTFSVGTFRSHLYKAFDTLKKKIREAAKRPTHLSK